MSTTASPGPGVPAAEGALPPVLSARLATLGTALLVLMPLAMWLANRSAPLVLGLATVSFGAAAIVAEGWRPLLSRLLGHLRGAVGLCLCAFIAWSLVTLAWSHRPVPGLAAWGEMVLPLGCGLAIVASGRFRHGIAADRGLAWALVAAAALMMAELASDLSLRVMLGVGKQQGFIFNRPALTCLVLTAAVLPGLLRPGAMPRDRLLAGLALLALVALASDSDSGATSFGLAIMAVTWLAARVLPRLTLSAVALGFATTMLLSPVTGRLVDASLPPALHEKLASSHTRERTDIWLSFGEAIMARPLLGSGFGTSSTLDRHPVAREVSPTHRPMLAVGHPHSAPMQAWVETGAVGAALLAFAGLAFLYRLRHLATRDLAPRLALAASAFAIASVAHGAWQGWWIAALAAAAVWLCVSPSERGRDA
ncbi:O-antigen ligase family protein [Bosea sp. 124]|uniref:O-antigen ligase family protein n=1 Tax=Bosea sp. 124 TaxID=2135642 RepID=UPI000D3B22F3|nr:O-antigen ligase family protein [Bosea sp. 124]PTM38625.1 O-antigen ligase [Bosea sp. 124]